MWLIPGSDALNDFVESRPFEQLPNALHFKWSMCALEAGKHVLVEKPTADTAHEARQIFALAEKKGLVVLEGIHFT